MKNFLKIKNQSFARGISTNYSTEGTKSRNFIMNTLSSRKKSKIGRKKLSLHTVIQSESLDPRRRHRRITENQGGRALFQKQTASGQQRNSFTPSTLWFLTLPLRCPANLPCPDNYQATVSPTFTRNWAWRCFFSFRSMRSLLLPLKSVLHSLQHSSSLVLGPSRWGWLLLHKMSGDFSPELPPSAVTWSNCP